MTPYARTLPRGQRRLSDEPFELTELLSRQAFSNRRYLEFLPSDSTSVGLYVLPAGGVDAQLPHTEDEVYVVLAGRARFTVGDETRSANAGDVMFVSAGVPHRFHDPTEELRLIVVFAPESSST